MQQAEDTPPTRRARMDAERMAACLHGASVHLLIAERETSPTGLCFLTLNAQHDNRCVPMRETPAAGVPPTRVSFTQVCRWERELRRSGHSPCTSTVAREVGKRWPPQMHLSTSVVSASSGTAKTVVSIHDATVTGDWAPAGTTNEASSNKDRDTEGRERLTSLVSLFLYQCQYLHRLDAVTSQLIAQGAMTPHRLRKLVISANVMVGEVTSLADLTVQLTHVLEDWQRALEAATLVYPGLSLFSGARLGEVRAAFEPSTDFGAADQLATFFSSLLPRTARDAMTSEGTLSSFLQSTFAGVKPSEEDSWLEALGVATEGLLTSAAFHESNDVDSGAQTSWMTQEDKKQLQELFSIPALIPDMAVTSCMGLQLAESSSAEPGVGASAALMLSLGMYLCNLGRLPFAFETFICAPSTTNEELTAFLAVWTAFFGHERHTYLKGEPEAHTNASRSPSSYPPLCFSIMNVECLSLGTLQTLCNQIQKYQNSYGNLDAVARLGGTSQTVGDNGFGSPCLGSPSLVLIGGASPAEPHAQVWKDNGYAHIRMSLRGIGAVGQVEANAMHQMEKVMQTLFQSHKHLLGDARISTVINHAALPFATGGDAVAWKHFGPPSFSGRNGPMLDAAPKQHYLRCDVLDLPRQSRGAAGNVLLCLDVDPCVHPSEVNKVLFSLLVSGSVAGGLTKAVKQTYVTSAKDRCVIVLTDPAPSYGAGNATPVHRRYFPPTNCLAYQVLTQEALPCELYPCVMRLLPVPLSSACRVNIAIDACAMRAVQAVLLALGCQAGILPHFPLPDVLDVFFREGAGNSVCYYSLEENREGAHRGRKTTAAFSVSVTPLTPDMLFGLMYQMVMTTQRETLLPLGGRPPTARAALLATRPPSDMWVPSDITGQQKAEVFRFFHQLSHAVHALLSSSVYQDTRALVNLLPAQAESAHGAPSHMVAGLKPAEGQHKSRFMAPDSRLTHVVPPGSQAMRQRLMARLLLVQQAVLSEVSRCADLVHRSPVPGNRECEIIRAQGVAEPHPRGGHRSASPVAANECLTLARCSVGTTFASSTIAACAVERHGCLSTKDRGTTQGMQSLRNPDLRLLELNCEAGPEEVLIASRNDLWGPSLSIYDRTIVSLIKSPLRLLSHVAARPNFGAHLRAGLARLSEYLQTTTEAARTGGHKERTDDNVTLTTLPQYEDLVTVYVNYIEVVQEKQRQEVTEHSMETSRLDAADEPSQEEAQPSRRQSNTYWQFLCDMQACVEHYLQDVEAHTMAPGGRMGNSRPPETYLCHTEEPPFTVTPCLVQCMLDMAVRLRVGESVVLMGDTGSGTSTLAAYYAGRSGLPYDSIACHRAMTPQTLKAAVEAALERMSKRYREGVHLFCSSSSSLGSAKHEDDDESGGGILNVTRKETSGFSDNLEKDAVRCLIVLDDIDQFRYPWFLKQLLVDDGIHRFGRGQVQVQFLATMRHHSTSGSSSSCDTTVLQTCDLLQAISLQVPSLTSARRWVSRAQLGAILGDSEASLLEELVTFVPNPTGHTAGATGLLDSALMIHQSVKWMWTKARCNTPEHPHGIPLHDIMGSEASHSQICASITATILSVVQAQRSETRKPTPFPPSLQVPSESSAAYIVTPSLRLVWRWVHAFLFLIGLYVRTNCRPIHPSSLSALEGEVKVSEDAVRSTGPWASTMAPALMYGATVLSSCLHLPKADRVRVCSAVVHAVARDHVAAPTEEVEASHFFVHTHRGLVGACTPFPARIYATQWMQEVSLAMQFAAFHASALPLLVQGPPGTGKTLCLDALMWQSKVTGPRVCDGRHVPLVKCTLPCSPNTTPREVEAAAREVADVCLSGSQHAILEVDEVGCLADYALESLYTLQRIMDRGVYVPRTRRYHPIHIVCLTSTPLAATVTDRMLQVKYPLAPVSTDSDVGMAPALAQMLGAYAKDSPYAWQRFGKPFSKWIDQVKAKANVNVTLRDIYAIVDVAHYLLDLPGTGTGDSTTALRGVRREADANVPPHALLPALAMNLGICGDSASLGWLTSWRELVAHTTDTKEVPVQATFEIPVVSSVLRRMADAGNTAREPSFLAVCDVCLAMLKESRLLPREAWGSVRPIGNGSDPGKSKTPLSRSEKHRHCDISAEWLASPDLLLPLAVYGRPLQTPVSKEEEHGIVPLLRHPMLVGPVDLSMQLLRQRGVLTSSADRPVCVVAGGHGPVRDEDWDRDVQKARAAILEGSLLVLVNAPHMCYALSNVLDPSDAERASSSMAVLSCRGYTERISVHHRFRVLALVDAKAFQRLEPFVQSRFAKFQVDYESVLTEEEQQCLTDFYHRLCHAPSDSTKREDKEKQARDASATFQCLAYLLPGINAYFLRSVVAAHSTRFVDLMASRQADAFLIALLDAAVCPWRYLAMKRHCIAPASKDTNSLPVEVCSTLLAQLHDPMTDKDDLPSAWRAYRRKVASFLSPPDAPASTSGTPAARHALVFTGQRPHFSVRGAHVDLLGAAWACAVREETLASLSLTADSPHAPDATSAPVVRWMAAVELSQMTAVQLQQYLEDLKRSLESMDTKDAVISCVVFLLEQQAFTDAQPLPQPKDNDSAASAAWHLQRFFMALTESGLAEVPCLRMCVVVSLEPMTIAIPPAREVSRRVETITAPPPGWAILGVDEVYACECAALWPQWQGGEGAPTGNRFQEHMQTGQLPPHQSVAVPVDNTPFQWRQEVFEYKEPIFQLSTLLRDTDRLDAQLSLVNSLVRDAALLRRIVQVNAAAVAQEMEEYHGSRAAVGEWYNALEQLLSTCTDTPPKGSEAVHSKRSLGDVLLGYLRAQCQARVGTIAAVTGNSDPRTVPTDTHRDFASTAHSTATASQLLQEVVSSRTSRTATGADAGSFTLRSVTFALMQRVVMNLFVHLLAILFPSPCSLMDAVRASVKNKNDLSTRFVEFFLTKCGLAGGMLPLDALTCTSTSRLVSARGIRLRQPFFCRQHHPSTTGTAVAHSCGTANDQVPSRLPLSYPIYQLVKAQVEAVAPQSTTGRCHGAPDSGTVATHATELIQTLDRETSHERIANYLHDALLYFLEETNAAPSQGTLDDHVLWCMEAMIALRLQEAWVDLGRDRMGSHGKQAKKRSARTSATSGHWARTLGATACAVAHLMEYDRKWLLKAHTYSVLMAVDNTEYVTYLRGQCPLGFLVTQRSPPLFTNLTDLYTCMAFCKPVPEAERQGTRSSRESKDSSVPPPQRLRCTPWELLHLAAHTKNEKELQWAIHTQRLSYMLLPDEQWQHGPDGSIGRSGVVTNLLRERPSSPEALCVWLGRQLQTPDSKDTATWLRTEVAPLVVAQLCLWERHTESDLGHNDAPASLVAATPAQARSSSELMVSRDLMTCMLSTLLAETDGAFLCPARTMLTLVRASFERWLRDFSQEEGAPTGQTSSERDAQDIKRFPLEELARAVERNFEGELTRLIVCAVAQSLNAQLTHVHGSPPTDTTSPYNLREDVHTRHRLWTRLSEAWAPSRDGRNSNCYFLAVCLGVGVLQAEMESVRAWVAEHHANASATLPAMRALMEALWEFQCVWEKVAQTAGVLTAPTTKGNPESNDNNDTGEVDSDHVIAAQLSFPIYLLLLRVLSGGGTDISTARRLFPLLYQAAPAAKRPDFSANLLFSELLAGSEGRSMMNLVLNPRVVTCSEGTSPIKSNAIRASLMRAVSYLRYALSHKEGENTAPKPPLPDAGGDGPPLLRETCVGLEEWHVSVQRHLASPATKWLANGWDEPETSEVFATLALYLLSAGKELTMGGTSSLLSIVQRAETPMVPLHKAGGAPLRVPMDRTARRAAAMTAAVTSLCAVVASILQKESSLFTSAAERKVVEDWTQALLPSCPNCRAPMVDFAGCFAVECYACRTFFCAWCLMFSGDSGWVHSHVRNCPLTKNPGDYHGRIEQYFDSYLCHTLPGRLDALLERSSNIYVFSTRYMAFMPPLTQEHRALLTRIGTAGKTYVRFQAYSMALSLGYNLLNDEGLASQACQRAETATGRRLAPVPLSGYDVSMAAFENSLHELCDAFFAGLPRPSRPLLLKFMLAFLLSYKDNLGKGQSTEEHLRSKVANVGAVTLLSQLDAAMHADVTEQQGALPDIVALGPHFTAAVREGVTAGTPGALLPYLFRSVIHTGDKSESGELGSVWGTEPQLKDGSSEKWLVHTDADSEHSLRSSEGLTSLHTYRESYTSAAAGRLQTVLDFAFDARRVVRREFISQQLVHQASLAYLVEKHGGLFPPERVHAFTESCRALLLHLNRADNQCHAGEGFTMAETEDPARIRLSEAVGMDQGNLLHLLFSGSDAVGGDAPQHIGYGHSEYGQTRVLEALHGKAMGSGNAATDKNEAALLLDADTDLLHYDDSVPALLTHLLGTPPDTTPGLHTSDRDKQNTLLSAATGRRLVARVVCGSPGCFGRSALPVRVPELELDTTVLSHLLGAVEDWVMDTLSASPPTHGECGSTPWYARGMEQVTALVQAHNKPPRAGDDLRSDMFHFLIAYARFAQAVILRHSLSAPAVSGLGGAEERAGSSPTRPCTPPPLPSFEQVPACLLTKGQQSAQGVLCDARVDPRDAPVLLLASLPYALLRQEEGEGEDATGDTTTYAEAGWTAEQEATTVADVAETCYKLSTNIRTALVAALRMALLQSNILAIPTAGKTLAHALMHVCADYTLSERLSEMLGDKVHFSSVPRLLELLEKV